MKSITLTVTTGRSGTQLLHSLLMKVPDMSGDHEDERYPSFATVRRQNIINPSIGEEYVKNFLNYIDELPGSHYSLTDLSSSKGALEHYINLGIKPNIIILRRDPRLVAESHFSLDVIPYRSPYWREWYPSPDEPGVLPFENYNKAHSYQYCYWYCCDSERRAQYYKEFMRDCKIWETTTDELLNLNHFNDMLDHFALPNVDSVKTEVVDKWKSHQWTKREKPPRDFLHSLELDVLNRIPVDFKENLLSKGWGKL